MNIRRHIKFGGMNLRVEELENKGEKKRRRKGAFVQTEDGGVTVFALTRKEIEVEVANEPSCGLIEHLH